MTPLFWPPANSVFQRITDPPVVFLATFMKQPAIENTNTNHLHRNPTQLAGIQLGLLAGKARGQLLTAVSADLKHLGLQH